jgi:hypothetical protein
MAASDALQDTAIASPGAPAPHYRNVKESVVNLTVATLNLEEGREMDMLPDVVCLARDVNLLLQAGKKGRARFRPYGYSAA